MFWLRLEPRYVFAVLSPDIIAFCEDFGLRWQSAAATPLSGARPLKFDRETHVRAKAPWRFASRRRTNTFGCGLAALCLCVKKFAEIRAISG
jgi:hypothetical protein